MLFYKERYIKVNDNWYPCFEGQRIKLKLSLCHFKDYYVRLAAWGADDTAYEITYENLSFKEAVRKYNELIPFFENVPNNITKEWFIKKGFQHF